MPNFPEITPMEPLHPGLNARGTAKYSDVTRLRLYLGNGPRYGLG